MTAVYDVIIVGAGPAGAGCARACAQAGLSTLLLDKSAFPRSKPCGGALSGRALACLDFPLPEELIANVCLGVRVFYDGRSAEARRETPAAYLVDRSAFDALHAARAVALGARFREGEQVTEIREERDAITVETRGASYQGRFLVGADGVHSRVAAHIRPAYRKDELALALVSHPPVAASTDRVEPIMDYYYGAAPRGYGWLFPRRGHYSEGIAGIASRFAEPREALEDLTRRTGVALAEVQGHFIPYGGVRRTVAAGRILLAGDAAGFGDPFTGEGISYAILSGLLAGRAIAGSGGNGNGAKAAAARYQRETDRRIVRQLAIARRMAIQLERSPRLFQRVFFDHPQAIRDYLEVTAGVSDYRTFARRVLLRLPRLLTTGP